MQCQQVETQCREEFKRLVYPRVLFMAACMYAVVKGAETPARPLRIVSSHRKPEMHDLFPFLRKRGPKDEGYENRSQTFVRAPPSKSRRFVSSHIAGRFIPNFKPFALRANGLKCRKVLCENGILGSWDPLKLCLLKGWKLLEPF